MDRKAALDVFRRVSERAGRSRATATNVMPYPPPPSFYKLYDPAREEPPPGPPPPAVGQYTAFGATHTTEKVEDVLHSAKLYTTDGDIREELKRLNKDLLTRFTALAANMVQAPSQYQRRVEEISLLMNNIHHLLNAVRPCQARSTLEHALTEQAKQKRERLNDLREWTKKAEEAMGGAPAGLKEAVEEAVAAAESQVDAMVE